MTQLPTDIRHSSSSPGLRQPNMAKRIPELFSSLDPRPKRPVTDENVMQTETDLSVPPSVTSDNLLQQSSNRILLTLDVTSAAGNSSTPGGDFGSS